MKKIILSIMLIVPFTSFGQSKIEFLGSLNYSHRVFNDTSQLLFPEHEEIGKYNFHFGVNYQEKVYKNLWIRLGIGFTSMGYQRNINGFYFANNFFIAKQPVRNFSRFIPPNNGTGVIIIPTRIGEFTVNINQQFLEIPVGFKIETLKKKKIKSFIDFGVSAMYYLQTYAIANFNTESEVQTKREESITNLQFAMTLSFGKIYSFSDNLEFTFQSNFRFHFTKNTSLKEYLYSGGLAFGIRRKLH